VEVVIEGNSDGLMVTDTFLVAATVSGITGNALPTFRVFPNPSGGIFRTSGWHRSARVRIFNLAGAQVYQSILQNEGDPVDISDLPDGAYILMLRADGVSSGILILKQ
jgi:hypothetical protein